MDPFISIIVRTKNEERYLGNVLDELFAQSFQDFEVIIVDDSSTDKTLEMAEKYRCQIVSVPSGRFSHPYSCNLGAEHALGRLLVYTNGHAIPISRSWLQDGVRNFNDSSVAGIYACNLAHRDGTFADKILYNVLGYTFGSFRFLANDHSVGLMGTTNCIIRKDLWNVHHFDETWNGGLGGEDVEWAQYYLSRGYKIIYDPKFRVYHSHHLRIRDILWQMKNWRKMGTLRKDVVPEVQRKYFT